MKKETEMKEMKEEIEKKIKETLTNVKVLLFTLFGFSVILIYQNAIMKKYIYGEIDLAQANLYSTIMKGLLLLLLVVSICILHWRLKK